MGRTRRSERSHFDDDKTASIGKRRNHARNVPGVGMRTLNSPEFNDDVELDEDIAIYLNNTRLYTKILK